MIEDVLLPQDLQVALGSERQDFVVQADHAQPLSESLPYIFFAILMLPFIGGLVFSFLGPILGPIFRGEEVHFTLNRSPVVAGPNNLGPIILPAFFLGVFVLVGVGFLGFGLYRLFAKGGYFVGTPTRLVHYKKGNMRSIDWGQFSGNIEVRGNTDKGTISLQLRTGKWVRSKNRPARYEPDVVYIAGIANVFEVEQICRRRIKENNPTPPATGYSFS